MKTIANITLLIVSLWCLCAHATESEKAGDRYLLVGSSGREDDAHAVALLDQVSYELIILASDGKGEPHLQEVTRSKYLPFVVDVSTMRVSNNRVFVVISFSGDPIGNKTTFVEVYDLTTGVRVFSGYSRLPATVRELTGDGQKELILYRDEQGFDRPDGPHVPVVYSFYGETFVRLNVLSDGRLRNCKSEVKKQFIAFREKLEAECRRFLTVCWDNEIAKASRQIDAFDVTDRY